MRINNYLLVLVIITLLPLSSVARAQSVCGAPGVETPTPIPNFPTRITGLVEFDDGSGNALYAAGHFSVAGGRPAAGVARWTGTVWAPVGPGFNSAPSCLAAFNDGVSAHLVCGGDMTMSGTVPLSGIARWDPAFDQWLQAMEKDVATIQAATMRKARPMHGTDEIRLRVGKALGHHANRIKGP